MRDDSGLLKWYYWLWYEKYW